jgi:hypothetical protein
MSIRDSDRLEAAIQGLRVAKVAIEVKARSVRRSIRRVIDHTLHKRLIGRTERELRKALEPLFREQVRSIVSRLQSMEGKGLDGLGEKSRDSSSAKLLGKVFDPEDWREDLIGRALPVLAVAKARAIVAEFLTMGVDVRREGKKSRAKLHTPSGTKASTATRWLQENPEDLDELIDLVQGAGVPGWGVLLELPERMKQRVAAQLSESFKQDYWDEISTTTGGNAETVLAEGLRDGWSIRQMADAMEESLGGDDYARTRAYNIARTESGDALNAARSQEIDSLIADVGPEVPIKKTWLSVLGPTTREAHADLDGVPADEDGLWDLNGVMVPWPGHFSLDPSQRCNCFPASTFVSGDFVGAQRAWYEGAFTEIITKSGTHLTLTINHPVVTSKGLVAAGKLNPGNQVLAYRTQIDRSFGSACCGSEASIGQMFDDLLFPSSNQIEDEPAPIEQVFEAFFSGSVVGNSSSSIEIRHAKVDDFYGDGESIKGNIEVVRTNWKLLEDGNFGQFEKRGDAIFIGPFSNLSFESSLGLTVEGFGRTNSSSSCFPCPAKPLCDCFSSIWHITPTGSLSIGVAANLDVSLNQSSRQDGPSVAGFLRETLKRYPGFVAFDEVVEVRNFFSADHVYDLQSVNGFIVAQNETLCNGIVTANCQCSIITEFGMDEDEARGLIRDYVDRQDQQGEEEGETTIGGLHVKYSPDQPRVPAGNSDGGEWVSGESGGAGPAQGGSNEGNIQEDQNSNGRTGSERESYGDAKEWKASLNKDEDKAFLAYTSSNKLCKEIRTCQNLGKCTKRSAAYVENLRSALNRSPRFEGTVYRGLVMKNEREVAKFVATVEKNGSLVDKGFMSTSKLRGVAAVFAAPIGPKGVPGIILEIKSRIGCDIGAASPHPGEKEVIMNPGSRLKYTGMKRDASDRVVLSFEEE